jgi:SAM-dependent methyltransferase
VTVAREYFSRVLSPWSPGVVGNPLPRWVAELARPDGTAVDVGCGPGVLLCDLAQRFGRVVAVDRDSEMIAMAEELVERLRAQGASFGEIELRCQDWAEVDDLRGADLVCAVNSILEPEPGRRARMLAGLRDALAIEGTLVGVFPAMESQVHLLRLYAAELARLGVPEDRLRRRIDDEFLTAHGFDALAGTFSSRGEPPQKFSYQMELAWELRDAGFEPLELTRVVYPWDVCRQVDAGYFPGEVELFDWSVRARRSTEGSGRPTAGSE